MDNLKEKILSTAAGLGEGVYGYFDDHVDVSGSRTASLQGIRTFDFKGYDIDCDEAGIKIFCFMIGYKDSDFAIIDKNRFKIFGLGEFGSANLNGYIDKKEHKLHVVLNCSTKIDSHDPSHRVDLKIERISEDFKEVMALGSLFNSNNIKSKQ